MIIFHYTCIFGEKCKNIPLKLTQLRVRRLCVEPRYLGLYCTVLPSGKIKIVRRFFLDNWYSRWLRTGGVATGVYIGIYTPPKKSAQVNFLWGKNDVRTAIQQFYIPQKLLYPQNKFLATPLLRTRWEHEQLRSSVCHKL